MNNYKYLFFLLFGFFLIFSCEKTITTPPEVQYKKPQFIVSDTDIVEGSSDRIELEIEINGFHENSIIIPYRTQSVSADSTSDYGLVEGELVFSSSDSIETQNIFIDIIDDEFFEPLEHFELIFEVDTSIIANKRTALISILDNDIEFTDNEFEGYVTLKNKEDWKLIWSDEFSGTEINLDAWNIEDRGNWYNEELQYYTPDNATVDQGLLTIVAKPEERNGHHYTSTRMQTKHKVHFTHGWIDIRAKLPYSKGLWPALWMLGENIDEVSWPKCGEIDIMELRGHKPNEISSTIHFKNKGGNHQFPSAKKKQLFSGDFSTEFHVFSMYWNKYRVDFYVDDIKYNTIFFSSLNFHEDENPFLKEFYVLMNVAVGGVFGGDPNSTTVWPQKMDVDYVRIYQEE